MYEIFQVVLLGVIEGLTEFIPVSSTGHLILVAELIELSLENNESFSIFIQLGAIASVVVLYRDVFLQLLKELFSRSRTSNGFSIIHVIAGCLPILFLGFLTHKLIKLYLFNSLTVALALIFGGVMLILVEKRKVTASVTALNTISVKQAFLVGLFQCFALWPGMSRSGSTIIGAVLAGLDRKTAAEFSFILAVPVMFIAVIYDTYTTLPSIQMSELWMFALGSVVAFLVALLSIRLFIGLLQHVSLVPFGVYRIIIGIVVLVWVS